MMLIMRTTVTLDRDVEAMLREKAHRTHVPFKRLLNETLRLGLALGGGASSLPPYQVQARPMGMKAGIDPIGLSKLADDLEAEVFIETTRRLHDPKA